MSVRSNLIQLLVLSLLLPGLPVHAEDDAPAPFLPEQLTFFEAKVRPVLIQHCYSCHSHQAEKLKAGLYLDSRAEIMEAGIVEPGKPDESILIEAIRWQLPKTEMPPTHKLPDAVIADLAKWVAMGLPWPTEAAPSERQAEETFDLEARKASHWAWQPPHRASDLPSDVADTTVRTIDYLIDQALDAKGLSRSAPADKLTLIRRVTFDLTGLPPTPAEIEAFLNDTSPDAYETLVDRLLASPRFGETWARHWLDLVRYAETHGHEFDFDIHAPWRYRDYVIRALNDDIPYDQFVREHIAGDLLPEHRYHPDTGEDQSVLATGFYWLGEQTHSPVDAKAHQADRIDNQIDVLTKTFQAMTVSCARCHDHKFDAISTRDYYALYGIIQSTRWSPTELTARPEQEQATTAAQLESLRSTIETTLREQWNPADERIDAYLLVAQRVIDETGGIKDNKQRDAQLASLCESYATEAGLDTERARGWIGLLQDNALREGQHPLHAWHVVTTAKPEDATRWWAKQHDQAVKQPNEPASPREGDTPILDIANPATFDITGSAFSATPVEPGRLLAAAGRGQSPGQIVAFPGLTSANSSSRQQGALRTHTTPITQRYIHVLAQGNGARINAVVDGFKLIRWPIYGGLRQIIDTPYPRWYTFDLDKWDDGGHDLYVEIIESPAGDPSANASPDDAHATVYAVLASDHPSPPGSADSRTSARLGSTQTPSREELAKHYQSRFAADAIAWQSGATLEPADAASGNALLSTLLNSGLLELPTHDPAASPIAQAVQSFRQLDAKQPLAPLGLASAEGTGRDCPIFVRGSHHAPGDNAPRGYLEAIVGHDKPQPANHGSGRLELANTLTDPSNPLTSRVIVNRLWHHLFGQGIVASVDNFGYLGSPPTHPQLLDHLAVSFIEDDHWSIKAMLRHIVLSQTYQQTSDRTDSQADQQDPNNLLLHRQNIRRLPAEGIRDSILAVSGELNAKMYGRSIAPHLTAFMDGRGRPGRSGPLDGDRRRSIYLGIRRNFLSPMMLTYDMPIPFSTMGKRNVSNVPAQALILMNDPFVHDQADKWSKRLVQRDDANVADRIDAMFLLALGRAPEDNERDAAAAYVQAQASKFNLSEEQVLTDPRPWRELGHVVFNLKGFVYIR